MDVVGGYPSAPAGGALEIRMLGRWEVRRADGAVVPDRAWRTGKNADLIRMLAVQPQRPVSIPSVMNVLWPDSDERRAQNSMRTAVSLARSVVGAEHVERTVAGLRLRHVWVDLVAFRRLAAAARSAVQAGDYARATLLARDADDVYAGDLRAHDETAEWVATERRSLAAEYLGLLCDGAEAAIGEAHGHDAAALARRALGAEPFSERASRLLMRAWVSVGELPLALQEYERCRLLLAEELGIDPSPQTQAVYFQLLRGTHAAPRTDDAARAPAQAKVAAGLATSAESAQSQADARIQVAMSECIPKRQFARCRIGALAVAEQPVSVHTRVRALTVACLPDLLLGRPRAAAPILNQAMSLLATPEPATAREEVLRSRLQVLTCLLAHDTGSADFSAWWRVAQTWSESGTDVNWAWVTLRIAAERDDHDTLRAALQLRVSPGCGPFARRLHALASAVAVGQLGDTDDAVARLRAVIETEDSAHSTLLLPEALARLILLQAPNNPVSAGRDALRLEAIMETTAAMPRESCLWLLARAELEAARGRVAAASADAATASQIAQDHGLQPLAAIAREHWSRHFDSARVWTARELPATLPRLRLDPRANPHERVPALRAQ